jgi:hypothetical protein
MPRRPGGLTETDPDSFKYLFLSPLHSSSVPAEYRAAVRAGSLRILRSRGVRLPLEDASHNAFGGVYAIGSSRWRLVGLRRSLLGLHPSPGGALEVFPDVLVGRSEDRPTPPPQACSSFRALSPCLAWAILSWDSSASASPPTCDRASTPGCRCRHPSVGRCNSSDPVPSLRFRTALTASSARPLQVCCALLPAMRFTVFRASGPRTRRSWVSSAVPTARFIPLEGFPSSVAVPHRCGRCPPAVAAPSVRRSGTVHRLLRSDPKVLAVVAVRVLPAWAVALGRTGRSRSSVWALRFRGTQGTWGFRSEQAPTSGLLAWGPFHVGVWSPRRPPVPFHERSHRSGLLSGPGPLHHPSFLGIRWCSLRGRAGDAGALGVDIAGDQVARSFSVGVHHPRMALPAGAAVDESTSAASLPVRRSACADHLGPVMDPGLAAGGVHPGTTVPICRSRSSRPPSGASSSGPSLPFDRRSGRSTRASRPWWSADVRLAAASGSRLRDCRSGHGGRDRATVAGRSWHGALRPRTTGSGVAPLADLPSRWWDVTVICDVPSEMPPVSVSGDGLRCQGPPRFRGRLRFRGPWVASREQSAPGPCSTGESVAFLRRFQRWNALSFHGLCSPPRSSLARSSAGSGFSGLPCGRSRLPVPSSGSLVGSTAGREVLLAVARVVARRVCPGRVSHRRGGSFRPRACASGRLSPLVRCGPSWGS